MDQKEKKELEKHLDLLSKGLKKISAYASARPGLELLRDYADAVEKQTMICWYILNRELIEEMFESQFDKPTQNP